MDKLKKYGLTESFAARATEFPEYFIGRVLSQYKNLYKVVTDEAEFLAEVSGKFIFRVKRLNEYPAAGDFVMLDRADGTGGNGIIHHVLQRKSSFERKAVGADDETQTVAANIDIVFVCMSLNNDYNLRRLERYIALTWESGAVPVVILTKSDLCENVDEKLAEVSMTAPGVEIIVTSSFVKESYEQLKNFISNNKTAAFVGSSGVGKSTLINCLAGRDVFETNEIRDDDKGRHTTTRREMFALPGGGVVIDTPGMRELGIESADLSKTFTDVSELSKQCKFSDCTHQTETGCAVREAIRNGLIDEKRLESYVKLKKELKYEGLNSKQIETEKIKTMFAPYGGFKNAMRYAKEKNKRR